MKKGDIFIIGISFFILLGLFMGYKFSTNVDGKPYVEIRIKNELITSIKLTESTNMKILLITKDDIYQEYRILEKNELIPENMTGYDIIYIHNNGVQVIDADCPRRIVVRQGFMKYTNIPLVCLPRQLTIIIKSQNDNSEIDGIAS